MRGRRVVCAWLIGAMAVLAGPAAAAPPEPQLTDPCGPAQEVGTDLLPEAAPPWVDICSGWLESVTSPSGAPAVRVSVALASDITTRPSASMYYASWRIGDCLYSVEAHDVHPVTSPVHALGHRCGPSTEPKTYTTLPDSAFTEKGNVWSVTLVFDGELAEYGADYAPGATLTNLAAQAGLEWLSPNACYGTDCGGASGDIATGGRPYVIEARP